MLDTGSNVCIISPSAFDKVPLIWLGEGGLDTSSGSVPTSKHGVAVILESGGGSAVIEPAVTVRGQPIGSWDFIIGRAVLDKGKFSVGSGRFRFKIGLGPHEPIHR